MMAGTHAGATTGLTTPAVSRRGLGARLGAAISAAVGAVSGLVPHVLHHVGPLAGAALVTGAAGGVLFGAIGFVLMVPMLLRLRRRFGTWLAPAIALAVFATMFTVSTLWIGPAIRGDGDDAPAEDHEQHHAALPAVVAGRG
jgi:hypothetical protein